MNYKFYIIALFVFLILPLVISLLLLSPYFTPHYAYIYYGIKPYGQQIFSDKQTLWSFIGILSATLGILMGFLYKDVSNQSKFRILIKSLYEEILRNTDLILSGEVERPYAFTTFETINKEHIHKIKDFKKYRQIRVFYDELYYYREIVKLWRVTNPGDIITERQFFTCNAAIESLGGRKINPNMPQAALNKFSGNNKWEKLRTAAIEQKNRNIRKWNVNLKKEIKDIFGVNIN